MSPLPADRAYTYEVSAALTITAATLAAAQTTAATALAAWRTSLAALTENVELSFPEISGVLALSPGGQAGTFSVAGALVIGTDESESAQGVAKDAAANIVANPTAGASITLDQENGAYVLQQTG